jgi:D-3-phosphoglycerate dehydrogenase
MTVIVALRSPSSKEEPVPHKPTTVAIATGTFGPDSDAAPDPSIHVQHVLHDVRALAELTEAHALVVGLQRLGVEELECLPDSIRVIGRAGIGLDSIDLDAAARLGIAVVHQPSYATDEVADHATALVYALARNVVTGDTIARTEWPGWEHFTGMPSLRDATLGLIGLGRIGSAVAQRLAPAVGAVMAYDPAGGQAPPGVVMASSMDEVLRASDIVSLHAPLTSATTHMIDAQALGRMRPGALLVNVSRGGLIDEQAVADALHDGRLAGAALDVLSVEPPPADNPLLSSPRTILSPHVAWLSRSSSRRLRDWTLVDVSRVAHGHEPEHGRLAVPAGARGNSRETA